MSNMKVQSFCNVPFSWENKPGITKVAPRQEEKAPKPLLVPPPPPSPCALRRNSSKKGLGSKQLDDPFLAAYLECTKGSAKKSQGKASGRSRKKDWFVAFSCKNSMGFVEGAVVRMPEAKKSMERGRAELALGKYSKED